MLSLRARASALLALAAPLASQWRAFVPGDLAERSLSVCEKALDVLDRRERAAEQLCAEACGGALRAVRDSGPESGPACCRAEESCRQSLEAAVASASDARAGRATAESRASAASAATLIGWLLAGALAEGAATQGPVPGPAPTRSAALPLVAVEASPRPRGGIARPSDLRHGRPELEYPRTPSSDSIPR